ncbi:hypothetical protein CCR94_01185 [Rhodoblastus sphagnicola]|uniref:SHOCT domain-containing protein n=1 Tax=Rhodoblastus sphagnicola TaxID=333368 RepID=A0A2S6NG43_9HYPH|nr:SHOCT domain-containing protein [Rhodoblastus sphagnicola]MBB4197489.1 hypothetical protein [Rhodoblastus sphagnicola]PPQ33598.1 hypothetical protein CCR94_01185 [Rhodoblastus sphagnicola]
MPEFTTQARQMIESLANAHGVSAGAVESLLLALAAGNWTQAQFNHPELGGMGQWSQGGMLMIGDMFNNALKYKVGALCDELSGLLRNQPVFAPPPAQAQMQAQGSGQSQQQGNWGRGGASLFAQGSGFGAQWPSELGAPSSSGAQNDMSYAWFPATRRLAIRVGGETRIYDTGDHNIGGVSQQQSGDQSLTFTSQYGLVRVADLPLVSPVAKKPAEPAWAPQSQAAPDVPPTPPATPAAPPFAPADDIFALIERLAALKEKNILTEEEFAAKKTELLSRL